MSLFQNSVLNKYLKGLESEKLKEAYSRFTSHFHNPTIQKNIRNSKEEQYQGEFLIDLFVKVLGYTKNPAPDFNLTTELKNIKGAKKTDGAILSEGKALAVIELKGCNTTDLSKVETQAFGYKNNQPGCNYVITSNFEKLRFYIDNAVDFEEFNLFQLTKERFNILWLCLSFEYLFNDIPRKIKNESLTHEENITKKLYKDYSEFRNKIFNNIQKINPEYDKLTLFKKTQKLLDRFLFIFFAEDKLLLPPNSIGIIVNQWKDLRDKYDEYFPLYDRFKKYFGYLNTGHKGQQHDIFAYNGGLFAPDEILDNIKIDDDLLYKHTVNLSNYDFESEVGVNILGHIFEHSLNDIEAVQSEIEGISTDKSKSRRKKEGVFYTPKYITKYIVDNTIGKLCEEKKTELDIQEAEFEKERKGRQKTTLKKLSQQLENYRKWLLQITICDPACGSGAFLNQALEFLIAEHRYIDELQAKLFGDAMIMSEVENSILENNLYGVDINEESVEIAKLSLWLRTAKKGRKLSTLNNNIKCGNSLIDDTEVAGNKAFNWNNEFPQIFKEKKKKAHHITWVTHNSRTSQRMIDNKVQKGDAICLNEKAELNITETINNIVAEDKLNVLAYNICADHVHILLVCEDDELSNIVRKLKGKSSQKLKEHLQIPKEEKFTLWAQKYSNTYIDNEKKLWNTIEYIKTNRIKHELPINNGLQPIVEKMCCDYEHAFRTEHNGGFDVVIGNPPYVIAKSFNEYYKINFSTYKAKDLYAFFYEKGINILKNNGLFGFISPSSYLTNIGFVSLRNYLIQFKINNIVDLGENVFTDASVDSAILILQKNKNNNQEILCSDANFIFRRIKQNLFLSLENIIFNIYLNTEYLKIANSIENRNKKFIDYIKFSRGVEFGFKSDKVFDEKFTGEYKPLLCGGNIGRYKIDFEKKFILPEYKNTSIYKTSNIYEEPKVLVRRIGNTIISSYDDTGYYNVCDVYNLQIKNSNNYNLKVINAILNSRLINFYYDTKYKSVKKLFPKIPIQNLKLIPIPNFFRVNQDTLFNKTNKMLELNKDFQKKKNKFLNRIKDNFEIEKINKKLETFYDYDFKTFVAEFKKQKIKLTLNQQVEWEEFFYSYKNEINQLQTKINTIDKEIDQMVYELYGLTEDEIKIVEEATK